MTEFNHHFQINDDLIFSDTYVRCSCSGMYRISYTDVSTVFRNENHGRGEHFTAYYVITQGTYFVTCLTVFRERNRDHQMRPFVSIMYRLDWISISNKRHYTSEQTRFNFAFSICHNRTEFVRNSLTPIFWFNVFRSSGCFTKDGNLFPVSDSSQHGCYASTNCTT